MGQSSIYHGFKEPVSYRVLHNLCNRNAVMKELYCCGTSLLDYFFQIRKGLGSYLKVTGMWWVSFMHLL